MHSEFSPPPFPRSAAWCSLVVFSLFPATLRAENEAPRLPSVEVSAARVVSTATRLDEDPLRLPFSTAVVTREEMDNSGARTLEEALRSVPGLQHGTQGNYYTRFETRGLRDTQDVLVLIGEHDRFQPPQLARAQIAALTNARSVTARIFTAAEHADQHCQLGNLSLAVQVLLDWLEG